jgi:hypothetical protein
MPDNNLPHRQFPEAAANGTSRTTPQPKVTPPALQDGPVSCRPVRPAAAVEQLLAAREGATLCDVPEATWHRIKIRFARDLEVKQCRD